jgi:predicted GNAT family acetyltransferase
MQVVQYQDADAFYTRVAPYLLLLEAEHNLTFGLLGNLRRNPERFPDALMRLVEDDGAIQLVALRTDIQRGLILSLSMSTEALALLADDLHASQVTLHGSNGPTEESNAFAEAWTRLTGVPHRVALRLGSYKLEKVKPVTGVSGHMRRSTSADRALLIDWEIAFRREAFGTSMEIDQAEIERFVDEQLTSSVRGLYIWEDGGVPVSIAGYAGPTPHGIRIGPVYTPPENRGRGYASACTAQMSQRLLDEGYEFCFLFTDLSNPTSNHIYQQIGYQHVCDFIEYHYGE